MAPKKKKKPAANPARGFATTSVPSKSQTVSGPDDVAAVDGSDHSQAPGSDLSVSVAVIDKNSTPKDAQNPQIQDMTPDQLEAHLENSELEEILDKHTARSDADTRRQVGRLETERRQLRPQAQKLSTYTWLPEETIDEVFGLSSGNEMIPATAAGNFAAVVDEEKLLVDLWTLEKVLLSLNFPRVSEAIAHIVELALLNQLALSIDFLPGLQEALQWYASRALPGELTNYEQTNLTNKEQSGDSTPAEMISGES